MVYSRKLHCDQKAAAVAVTYNILKKLQVNPNMRYLFISIFLILFPFSVNAEKIEKDAIPANIMDQIYKKHPNAMNIGAEKKTHFSQELLKIFYEEGEADKKEKFVDYYRPDGHYFVSGLIIAADDMMFTDSKEKLKSEFKDYHVKNAVLIVNPNGAGEEFDIILETGGKNWNVQIDKKGNVGKTAVD